MPIPVKVFPVTLRSPSGVSRVQREDDAIREALREVNRIWAQARVSVSLASIQARDLTLPSGLSGVIDDQLFFFVQSQVNDRDAGTVKAALVGQTAYNLHAGKAVIGGRFCLLPWQSGMTTQSRGRVFAHELGHLLGLPDFAVEIGARTSTSAALAATQNLMASSVTLGTLLTPEQITQANSSPLAQR